MSNFVILKSKESIEVRQSGGMRNVTYIIILSSIKYIDQEEPYNITEIEYEINTVDTNDLIGRDILDLYMVNNGYFTDKLAILTKDIVESDVDDSGALKLTSPIVRDTFKLFCETKTPFGIREWVMVS